MSGTRDPIELFMHELGDLYYAEQLIVKKLPGMIVEAMSDVAGTDGR